MMFISSSLDDCDENSSIFLKNLKIDFCVEEHFDFIGKCERNRQMCRFNSTNGSY